MYLEKIFDKEICIGRISLKAGNKLVAPFYTTQQDIIQNNNKLCYNIARRNKISYQF